MVRARDVRGLSNVGDVREARGSQHLARRPGAGRGDGPSALAGEVRGPWGRDARRAASFARMWRFPVTCAAVTVGSTAHGTSPRARRFAKLRRDARARIPAFDELLQRCHRVHSPSSSRQKPYLHTSSHERRQPEPQDVQRPSRRQASEPWQSRPAAPQKGRPSGTPPSVMFVKSVHRPSSRQRAEALQSSVEPTEQSPPALGVHCPS